MRRGKGPAEHIAARQEHTRGDPGPQSKGSRRSRSTSDPKVAHSSRDRGGFALRCAAGAHAPARVEDCMMETAPMSTTEQLLAPEHLGLQSRTDFRQQAVALLERLPEGDGRLVVDLSATRQVDSAG